MVSYVSGDDMFAFCDSNSQMVLKLTLFNLFKTGTLGDCTPAMHNWCERMTNCIIKDYNDNKNDELSNIQHLEIMNKTIDRFHGAIGWDNVKCKLQPSAPLSAGTWGEILALTCDSLITSGSINNPSEKVHLWHNNLGDIHSNDKPLIPDLRGFMKTLKDHGLIVAICTSGTQKDDIHLKFLLIDFTLILIFSLITYQR